jgi:integrase
MADFHTQQKNEGDAIGEASSNNGKSGVFDASAGVSPLCPRCGSNRVWRDALRYSMFGDRVQRWLCRKCSLRFSDPTDVQKAWSTFERLQRIDTEQKKATAAIVSNRQICVTETKNLAAEQQATEVLRRNETGEFKQKILEYALWLRSNGRSESTICGRVKLLRILTKRGANLYDPQSMKTAISEQKWSNGRKSNAADAYSAFLKMTGGTWEAPSYEKIRKLPFIPKETEIDQLISGCSPRMATFLQTMKETGARCGEIWQLKWDDVNFESKVTNITPEKGSNPRVLAISSKLCGMLQALPRNHGEWVFAYPHMPIDHHARNFCLQRKRLAQKLQNTRIMQIHFHTLRYWKGTMLYHQYRSEYYVMQQLGHKKIENTLLYIQLEEALFQGTVDYVSRVAKTENEVCKLIEDGFEFVCDFQGHKVFRKRK